MMENGSIELPCTPEEEARVIQELITKAESNLREGNLYYVISNRSSSYYAFLLMLSILTSIAPRTPLLTLCFFLIFIFDYLQIPEHLRYFST